MPKQCRVFGRVKRGIVVAGDQREAISENERKQSKIHRQQAISQQIGADEFAPDAHQEEMQRSLIAAMFFDEGDNFRE